MRSAEVHLIAGMLDSRVLATRGLAGGFSHETCLLTLADGQVVVRLGGADPGVEAAVMAAARGHVPVPRTLGTVPAGDDGVRSVMVLEYVGGTLLSDVLSGGGRDPGEMRDLGAEVGRVVAGIGAVSFDGPGFFVDERLTVALERPWSGQLAGFAEACMAATPGERLDAATKREWVRLCAVHAPALSRVDDHARLVHADINPKNILVSREPGGWRVDAVLDWEFGYSGCPYGDAANMCRFGADYPAGFLDGFLAAFAANQPAGFPLVEDWEYLGRVLDMFALSDLVTRAPGHVVADQAAGVIRGWVAG